MPFPKISIRAAVILAKQTPDFGRPMTLTAFKPSAGFTYQTARDAPSAGKL